MIDVRRIEPTPWPTYRQVRLAALADAPEAFSRPLARAAGLTDADDPGHGATAGCEIVLETTLRT